MPITIRMLILLGVVLGMPCLALPIVVQRLDGQREPTPNSATALQDRSVAVKPRGAHSKPRATVTAAIAPEPVPTLQEPFPTPAQRRRAETVQATLRDLGASYLVLDYNTASGRFRFRCEVALPEIPALRKLFQAQDRRPLPAMQQVLVEVEQWQARAARREMELEEASRR